jgi:anti-sigma B factor antagonist
MDIQVTLYEEIARVKLRGRLDSPGVDQIASKFTASVVPDGRNTVVDLSEVNFIASMGLRLFISIAKSLKRQNARLILFAPQTQVSEVFNTVLLHDLVPIVADEAEAVRFAAV